MSIEVIEKANEILKNVEMPDRHSFFQLQKFVIGKEVTGHAQLWQIVRELQARKETVDCYQKDLANAEDDLELFDLRIERMNREIRHLAKLETEEPVEIDLDIKEREINIRKLQREKAALVQSAQKVNKKLKYIIEEMSFLTVAYDAVVRQLGDVKPLDDEQAQKEMWNEKLLEEFNLRILLQKPLDPELVKTIMCLDDDSSVKQHLTKALEARQNDMIAQGKAQQKKIPRVEPKARVNA